MNPAARETGMTPEDLPKSPGAEKRRDDTGVFETDTSAEGVIPDEGRTESRNLVITGAGWGRMPPGFARASARNESRNHSRWVRLAKMAGVPGLGSFGENGWHSLCRHRGIADKAGQGPARPGARSSQGMAPNVVMA